MTVSADLDNRLWDVWNSSLCTAHLQIVCTIAFRGLQAQAPLVASGCGNIAGRSCDHPTPHV